MPQSNLDEYELYLELALKELAEVIDSILISPVAFLKGTKVHQELIAAIAQQEILEECLATYRRVRHRVRF